MWKMDPMSGCDIRVYITAQRQYTAVQKMRTPLKQLFLHYNLGSYEIIFFHVKNKQTNSEV